MENNSKIYSSFSVHIPYFESLNSYNIREDFTKFYNMHKLIYNIKEIKYNKKEYTAHITHHRIIYNLILLYSKDAENIFKYLLKIRYITCDFFGTDYFGYTTKKLMNDMNLNYLYNNIENEFQNYCYENIRIVQYGLSYIRIDVEFTKFISFKSYYILIVSNYIFVGDEIYDISEKNSIIKKHKIANIITYYVPDYIERIIIRTDKKNYYRYIKMDLC